MKIQLDFDEKVLTIENKINLKELFKTIQKILPDWKEWSIETNSVIYYTETYPIYRYYTNLPLYPQIPTVVNEIDENGTININNTTSNTLNNNFSLDPHTSFENINPWECLNESEKSGKILLDVQ